MKELIVHCLILIVLIVGSPALSCADGALLHKLDSAIALRSHYSAVKEHRIRKLTRLFHYAAPARRLEISTKLYQEYYTYRFDSAMYYVRQEQKIARSLGDKSAERRAQRHLAMLFAIGGYYSEAETLLKSVPVEKAGKAEMFEHYFTGYWIYNYWSDYCRDKIFSPKYDRLKIACLETAIRNSPEEPSPLHQYLLGELAFCKKRPLEEATRYYLKAIGMSAVNTRIYASAAYGVARNYRMEGRMREYEEWLIRAAISDQVNPLKENLALQELAMYLFKQDENNAEKSTRYIYCSMEDAQFYNNRLRMLEISQRLPAIVSVYQQQINKKRWAVTYLSMALGVFVILLLIGTGYIFRQSGKLRRRGKEIYKQNMALEKLNARLRETDEMRGRYMRLIMDLCATYIGKMNDYRKFVMRKVKTHQADELLRSATSTKLTEQEATQFYTQFDKAFMELYPSFVEGFNALLKPDSRIALSRNGGLTTEMRIYALVCLGVVESVEIATLLFYSPQTIYNYRTAMRKRAINPLTFEDDVRKLR